MTAIAYIKNFHQYRKFARKLSFRSNEIAEIIFFLSKNNLGQHIFPYYIRIERAKNKNTPTPFSIDRICNT